MVTTGCPECGRNVSVSYSFCPHCGASADNIRKAAAGLETLVTLGDVVHEKKDVHAKADQAIFRTVRESLVHALNIEENEIQLTSKIVYDLGAESIDFLDIKFRLEKAFDININIDEVLPETVQDIVNFIRHRTM